MSRATKIIDLEPLQARSFLREQRQYCSFDLPPYFTLEDILMASSSLLASKTLGRYTQKRKGPASCENVNYTVLDNKDGAYAWRPLQLIHPLLYMDLVNLITEKYNWNVVKKVFSRFNESLVNCISLPLKSETDETHVAETVTNWWESIEQKSLALALKYRYIFKTDISNCYGSIYTHSFEWAFDPRSRKGVKQKRKLRQSTKNLGTKIDERVRSMNQGQTIGIPQGSVLMDLLAEIVLGGTDLEFSDEIKQAIPKNSEFQIIRYRDDYRIFTNNFQVGHNIMKILSDVLFKWNMKMNSAKTSEGVDIISASIKSEKLEEVLTAPIAQHLQKQIMRIYFLSKKHPNSGLIAKLLTDFYDAIEKPKYLKPINYEVVIAVTAMIAFNSPKHISRAASIITKLIERSPSSADRDKIVKNIKKRFDDLPNTEIVDIWLQRIAGASEVLDLEFSSAITKVAVEKLDNSSLWNSEWLLKEARDAINKTRISSLKTDAESGKFDPVIEREEFELYRFQYPL